VEKLKKNVKNVKKRDLNKKRKKRLLHLWCETYHAAVNGTWCCVRV